MLRDYAEQILKLYNYIDGLVITNKKGEVVYFNSFRPNINTLTKEETVGKHIFELYPTLNKKTSSIMRVINNKKPIYNEIQSIKNVKGQTLKKINTTLPIHIEDKFEGVLELSNYVDGDIENKKIILTLDENESDVKDDALYSLKDIITADPLMHDIKDKVRRISKTNSSVLIYGATGTGKELFAQSIHSHSKRANKPFISQNCASIPTTLLESILFGTTKGSYTGALDKKGLFEIADGGTLFLDEINSMEVGIQAKLLKAIEEKKIRKVGGHSYDKIDVRIITAINEKPDILINNNKLRNDLYYRLSVVQLNLPLLKNRNNDVNLLTSHFIKKYNNIMNKNILNVDHKVKNIFKRYKWPGNVRELENVIEGAFNITRGKYITRQDLPSYLLEETLSYNESKIFEKYSLNELMNRYERKLILKAINSTNNKVEAAKKLKISKQSLNYKLKKYKINI